MNNPVITWNGLEVRILEHYFDTEWVVADEAEYVDTSLMLNNVQLMRFNEELGEEINNVLAEEYATEFYLALK